MNEPRIVVLDCQWFKCTATAVARRFDPFHGSHRPACALHCKTATPFELLPLDDGKGARS
jgi:hypothetical protein